MQIENLDHLGLIAGVIDELGLVELIDAELGVEYLQSSLPRSQSLWILTNCILLSTLLKQSIALSLPIFLCLSNP